MSWYMLETTIRQLDDADSIVAAQILELADVNQQDIAEARAAVDEWRRTASRGSRRS